MRAACLALAGLLAAQGAFAAQPPGAPTLSTGSPQGAPTLAATAGLGGVAKPGRWTPVRILVDSLAPAGTSAGNAAEDRGGNPPADLLVEWNGAAIHRRFVVSPPSRRQFEVYIRTPDVSGSISVRLRSNGVDLRTIDVPIRVVPADEAFTLCVASAESLSNDATACTVSVTPDALPRSMRGYDAADSVVWLQRPESGLAADQRLALEQWRGYRQLDDAGVLSLAPTSSAGPTIVGTNWRGRSLTMVAIGISVYAALMLMTGPLMRGIGGRPLLVLGAIALLATLGASVSLVAGHAGPASAIVVQYTGALQQLAGGGSTISLHGAIEYPAFGLFRTRAETSDSTFDLKTGQRPEEWFDEDGYPILSGVFGLGARREFTVEGVVALSPLDVQRREELVRVTNRSGSDLRDCRFPEGFSVQQVGTLRAGQMVEAREAGDIDTPFFSCALSEIPVDFVDERYAVQVESVSLVTAYLPPATAAAGPR